MTLFKGLDEVKELANTAYERAGAGFRGGLIFPSVFIGVACGLAVNSLVPEVPAAVAVAAATMGAVLAVDRDGWIALFLAAITVGDVDLLPLLCLTLAPLWLVVRLLPEFRTSAPPVGRPEYGGRALP